MTSDSGSRVNGEFVRSWTKPDMRFETADLQSHIRRVESGNTVGLLRDLVWIGQRATARQVAGSAGSAGGDTVGDGPRVIDLGCLSTVDPSFPSSRSALWF